MSRSYGSAQLKDPPYLSVFTPEILLAQERRTKALVKNLPAVKDQGSWPVCSAVVAVTLYEQLLLRESAWPSGASEMGWAWTYLEGRRRLLEQGQTVNAQLLTGVPLSVSLDALAESGVIAGSVGLRINDPEALRSDLNERHMTPYTRLEFPLRTLKVLPTATAIYDAIQAQYAVGFGFAVDEVVDRWLQDSEAQNASDNILQTPPAGAPRLATHAAVITGIDMNERMVTVMNSFGRDFGLFGFFFITFQALLRPDFANLEFYIITRTG